MKYAIYFTWKDDNFNDTFNVCNAKERDYEIKSMVARKEFSHIEYCPIFKSGEYGKCVTVI